MSQSAWPSLLTPGWATPSPGGLVATSRSRHSESDMAVTTAVTVEAQACLLAGVLKVEECTGEYVQLPYPSYPGQGWGV